MNKTIFTLGEKAYTFEDFARFIEVRQMRRHHYQTMAPLVTYLYEEFEMETLKAYFRERLELENEEYASTISEYRNGLLIFDLMNENVWQKAKTDSIGLNEYYNGVKENYKWNQRIEATLVSATSEAYAQQARNMLNEGKSEEEIKEALNPNKQQVNAIITSGIFEVDDRQLLLIVDRRFAVSMKFLVVHHRMK